MLNIDYSFPLLFAVLLCGMTRISYPGLTALLGIRLDLSSFFPADNGADCGGAAFIPFGKYSGRYTVAICFNDYCSLLWAKRFTAERGGSLHDVWDLRTVDDMKYQSSVWLDNHLWNQNVPQRSFLLGWIPGWKPGWYIIR